MRDYLLVSPFPKGGFLNEAKEHLWMLKEDRWSAKIMKKLQERCKNAFSGLDFEDRIKRVLAVENDTRNKGKDSKRSNLELNKIFSGSSEAAPPISFVEKLDTLLVSKDKFCGHQDDHENVLDAKLETDLVKPLQIKLPGVVNCWEKFISDSVTDKASINIKQKLTCDYSLLKPLTFDKGEAAEILRERQNKKWAFRCYENGKACLQKANANVNLNRGRSEIELERAKKLFQDAQTLDPILTAANLEIGLILAKQGKVDEAITCYKNILKIEPENNQVRARLRRLGVTVPYLDKNTVVIRSSSSSSKPLPGSEYFSGEQEHEDKSRNDSDAKLLSSDLRNSESGSSETSRKRKSEFDGEKERKRRKNEKRKRKESSRKLKKHKKKRKRKRFDYSD